MSEQGKLNLVYTSNEPETLSNLHERFIKHKLYAEGHSTITIGDYKYHFKMLLQFKPDITLRDLNEETLVNFLEYLNTRERKVGRNYIVRPYKKSTIATVRGKLSAFFNWLVERKYLSQNPFNKISYPEVTYTDFRAFTPREFESICHAVNTKIQCDNLLIKKRNIAIVMFLFYTGVRREELVGLKIKDLDFERKLITIRAETSKSKRNRFIPMNKELIPYLNDYLFYRKISSCEFMWLSSNEDRQFTKFGLKHFIRVLSIFTGINCHAHRFRHTFAVMYYLLTHDLVGLQKILGHSSLKMTLRYLRSIPDEHIVEQIQSITINEFI